MTLRRWLASHLWTSTAIPPRRSLLTRLVPMANKEQLAFSFDLIHIQPAFGFPLRPIAYCFDPRKDILGALVLRNFGRKHNDHDDSVSFELRLLFELIFHCYSCFTRACSEYVLVQIIRLSWRITGVIICLFWKIPRGKMERRAPPKMDSWFEKHGFRNFHVAY